MRPTVHDSCFCWDLLLIHHCQFPELHSRVLAAWCSRCRTAQAELLSAINLTGILTSTTHLDSHQISGHIILAFKCTTHAVAFVATEGSVEYYLLPSRKCTQGGKLPLLAQENWKLCVLKGWSFCSLCQHNIHGKLQKRQKFLLCWGISSLGKEALTSCSLAVTSCSFRWI